MSALDAPARTKLLQYDAPRRRLWIRGQRCHHGAAGSLVGAIACLGLMVGPGAPPMLALAAAGGAMMLHDWKDRTIWFERGPGSQP
jgi:hypothetical protein